MDHLLFPFCLTWFGRWLRLSAMPLKKVSCRTASDNCPPGTTVARFCSGLRKWSLRDTARARNGRTCVRTDWCCCAWLLFACLEETDWYFLPFLFNCLICMIASFLQEYVSDHWMKNVGDMCQFMSPNEWHRVDLGMPVESLGCTIPLPHVFGL